MRPGQPLPAVPRALLRERSPAGSVFCSSRKGKAPGGCRGADEAVTKRHRMGLRRQVCWLSVLSPQGLQGRGGETLFRGRFRACRLHQFSSNQQSPTWLLFPVGLCMCSGPVTRSVVTVQGERAQRAGREGGQESVPAQGAAWPSAQGPESKTGVRGKWKPAGFYERMNSRKVKLMLQSESQVEEVQTFVPRNFPMG